MTLFNVRVPVGRYYFKGWSLKIGTLHSIVKMQATTRISSHIFQVNLDWPIGVLTHLSYSEITITVNGRVSFSRMNVKNAFLYPCIPIEKYVLF